MIPRIIKNAVITRFNRGKIIHVPGPRQVGKTTLLKDIVRDYSGSVLWLNGDEADVRMLFTEITSSKLGKIIGKNSLLIIDGAQRIQNIGLALKILADNFPAIQVIATGSSSFDLANQINEPLTGRKTELFLFPLSFAEMVNHTSLLEERRLLEHRMIYGYYPEVVTSAGNEKEVLQGLTDAYLYKDLFALEWLKKQV
jgi:predicted AAA+ superfamily ATPase